MAENEGGKKKKRGKNVNCSPIKPTQPNDDKESPTRKVKRYSYE